MYVGTSIYLCTYLLSIWLSIEILEFKSCKPFSSIVNVSKYQLLPQPAVAAVGVAGAAAAGYVPEASSRHHAGPEGFHRRRDQRDHEDANEGWATHEFVDLF